MRDLRFGWLLAAFVLACGWSVDASAEGFFERYYELSWYYPGYQNNYHGYWRDLGYGFTNRPAYGAYYRSERYLDAPFYGLPNPERIYSVPSGRRHRW